MVKELLLAILLGALLGFGLTGSILGIKQRRAQPIAVSPTPTVSPLPATSPPPTGGPTPTINPDDLTLTVSSPQDESVVSTAKIEIIGLAPVDSIVVIKSPKGIYSTTADSKGAFSQIIELDSGYNTIHISSVDNLDNQASVNLNVTYSTAKF